MAASVVPHLDTPDADLDERLCAACGESVAHKRASAIYCDRTCKTRASDRRRAEDGRARARDRLRYPNEAEIRRAQAREAYWRDPDGAKLAAAARRRANPLRRRHSNDRRAALADVNGRLRITERDWQRLCARFDGRCAYCGAGGPLTRDHVIPLSRGGRDSLGNLLPACRPCNSSKHTALLTEWRRRRRP